MNDATPLVVANQKANKNWEEVKTWIAEVGPTAKAFPGTVILCPTAPFLSGAYELIKDHGYKIKLGIQDVSQFEKGAHTGEVAASQLQNLASYVIIGHSERRDNFLEDESLLQKKVDNAQAVGIEPIYCVQGENTPIAKNVQVIAYEPSFAIGTGKPDTLDNIARIAKKTKDIAPYVFIYGGSVSKDNIRNIALLPGLDGVLVGATNSLDSQDFAAILKLI